MGKVGKHGKGRWDRGSGGRLQIDCPKTSSGVSGSRNAKVAVFEKLDGIGGKRNLEAVVTKLAKRKQGFVVQVREDVGAATGNGEARQGRD